MSRHGVSAVAAALAALLIIAACEPTVSAPAEMPAPASATEPVPQATGTPAPTATPRFTATPRPWILQHPEPIEGVAFSPDGSLLAVSYVEQGTMPDPKFAGPGDRPFQAGTNTSWLHIWDLRTGKEKLDAPPDRNAGVVLVIECPQGRLNCNNPPPKPESDTVVVMDCIWADINCHDPASVAFSRDGSYVVAANGGNLITVWDAQTLHLVRYYQTKGTDRLTSIALSPDGRSVAVGGWNGAISLSDFNSGSTVRVLTGHSGWVNDIDFSPDGSTLVSGSADGTLRLWDLKRGTARTLDDGDHYSIESVSFSPDGKVVAAGQYGGMDSLAAGSVVLWDAASGKVQNSLAAGGGAVDSVTYSPDGRLLVYATSDGTITLWDVAAAQEISVLRPSHSNIHIVAFAPDGKTLASAHEDGVVMLWPMPQFSPLPAPTSVASPTPDASDDVSPVIDSVELRYKSTASGTVVYQDIRFHDPDGDATRLHYEIVTTTSTGTLQVGDGRIDTPMHTQQLGTVLTGTWNCGGAYDVTLRVIIIDRIGHKSAPVDYTINCK